MASYHYLCNKCSIGKKYLVFEVTHGMNEKPKVKCPKCGKTDTEVTWIGVEPPIFYTRGYGWLDVAGRRRDMHLWKLQNDDPYKSIRPRGEKDDLAQKLRSGGKHQKNAKSFYVSKKSK